ncbi:hypothetical protein BN1708_017158, partial [Verticillium longisporum]
MPDVDLSDPNLDPTVQQEFRSRELARSQAKMRQDHMGPGDREDAQLLSMIESIGQLDMDDRGGWDFHGVSSGAVFLRRMNENFQGLMGPATKAPFLPRKERPYGLTKLDSPASAGSSPQDLTLAHGSELPPKEFARKLCYYSLSCGTCLIRIVADELKASSGLVFLPGEPSRTYEYSDMGPAFHQRRYFFYLAGVNVPDCAVTYSLADDRLTVWIPHVEPRKVLYNGRVPSIKDVLAASDVDEVRHMQDLPAFLHAYAHQHDKAT